MVSNSLHKFCREKNRLFLGALSTLSTLADLSTFNSCSGVASAFLSKLVTRAGYVNSQFFPLYISLVQETCSYVQTLQIVLSYQVHKQEAENNSCV